MKKIISCSIFIYVILISFSFKQNVLRTNIPCNSYLFDENIIAHDTTGWSFDLYFIDSLNNPIKNTDIVLKYEKYLLVPKGVIKQEILNLKTNNNGFTNTKLINNGTSPIEIEVYKNIKLQHKFKIEEKLKDYRYTIYFKICD